MESFPFRLIVPCSPFGIRYPVWKHIGYFHAPMLPTLTQQFFVSIHAIYLAWHGWMMVWDDSELLSRFRVQVGKIVCGYSLGAICPIKHLHGSGVETFYKWLLVVWLFFVVSWMPLYGFCWFYFCCSFSCWWYGVESPVRRLSLWALCLVVIVSAMDFLIFSDSIEGLVFLMVRLGIVLRDPS